MSCTKPLFDTWAQEWPPKSHDEHTAKMRSTLNSKVNFFFPCRKWNSCERQKTILYGPHIYLRCDRANEHPHIAWSAHEGQLPCKKSHNTCFNCLSSKPWSDRAPKHRKSQWSKSRDSKLINFEAHISISYFVFQARPVVNSLRDRQDLVSYFHVRK